VSDVFAGVFVFLVIGALIWGVLWFFCAGCAYQRCVDSGNFMVRGVGCVTEGADGALRRVR
jgi:hypothetical protein